MSLGRWRRDSVGIYVTSEMRKFVTKCGALYTELVELEHKIFKTKSVKYVLYNLSKNIERLGETYQI